jgi:serine protease Do/serine protease DegQ
LSSGSVPVGATTSIEKKDRLTRRPLLVKRTSPAVVGIRGWGVPSEPRILDPEAGFPDPPSLREWQGAGVIVDALAGLIVTANHLVANATVVKALLQDGRALNAVVLAIRAR